MKVRRWAALLELVLVSIVCGATLGGIASLAGETAGALA